MYTQPAERAIEVRCCCQASKVIGWVFLPFYTPLEERVYEFARQERGQPPIALQLRTFVHRFPSEGDEFRQFAFSSDEMPITTLRQIDGFVEKTASQR
jgi:hypothetical protein